MKTVLLVGLLALSTSVDAHGGMVKPTPRAISTMGLDIGSTFGHPISMRASYTKGKGGDCLKFTPDTKLQPLATGSSVVEVRANDGANHVGPCKMSLVNPTDTSKRIEVGSHENCMRSLHPAPGKYGDAPIKGEIKINVPSSGLPCGSDGHCILFFEWEATHLQPHELFNNCADVKVDGSSSGGGGDKKKEEPPASTPKPESPSTVAPQSGKRSKSGGGKYKYVGKGGDQAAMDQWCNWNCPSFCPEDICSSA